MIAAGTDHDNPKRPDNEGLGIDGRSRIEQDAIPLFGTDYADATSEKFLTPLLTAITAS